MNHVKSLDGIRGIAVSLVVAFHFGVFSPGWVGVQIFFVLSGYLITNILLRESERPLGEYVGRFYWRRSLRIFPLYFVYLVASCAAYMSTGGPKSFPSDWPFLVTYTANFARLRESDIGPAFVHLWSLAVEEQFYLLWPLLVYFLPFAAFKRVVATLLVLCPFVRLGLYFIFQAQGHDADWIGRNIYCLPISQFDAFAAGAAVVIWKLDRRPNAGRWLIAGIVLLGICGLGVLAHDHYFYKSANKASLGYAMYLLPCWGFVWGYSLLNLVSVLGIVCALQSKLKFLENFALVRVGVVSYGVYVYHVPLGLMLHSAQFSKPMEFALYVPLVLLVSEISFRLIETPFLRLKDRRPFGNLYHRSPEAS
jgi:peptidoglycan/LPS O-acetylase OafA/YrhL